jgi:lysophospholipase L1-like esterase
VLRKEPLFLLSDSMLRDIGEWGLLLNQRFQCYINTYGGYNLKRLTAEVQKSSSTVKSYFKTVVVMAGTNDSHGDRDAFDLGNIYTFIKDFKAFLTALISKLDPEKVVVLSLLPRAYCKHRNCNKDSRNCRNVHKNSDTGIEILNTRINNMNKEIEEILQTDIRFVGKAHFCNLFYPFLINLVDGSNHLLNNDGLHMSRAGVELIDKHLDSIL